MNDFRVEMEENIDYKVGYDSQTKVIKILRAENDKLRIINEKYKKTFPKIFEELKKIQLISEE